MNSASENHNPTLLQFEVDAIDRVTRKHGADSYIAKLIVGAIERGEPQRWAAEVFDKPIPDMTAADYTRCVDGWWSRRRRS